MKKLIPILVFSSLLACDHPFVYNGRRAYKSYFREHLKDPNSLVIYNEKIIERKGTRITFEVDMGSRNSYGGMARETYVFETVQDDVITVNGRLNINRY